MVIINLDFVTCMMFFALGAALGMGAIAIAETVAWFKAKKQTKKKG